MKKLAIIFILLFSSSIAFAQGAKVYLKDGDFFHGKVDATGYGHGIEMNTPGTAYIVDAEVRNADTNGMDGRGIVATGVGAHIIVYDAKSYDNSEDGFRAVQGGKITVLQSEAYRNGKNGFFVGAGSSMDIAYTHAFDNQYGVLAASGFIEVAFNHGSSYRNERQGIHMSTGESLVVKHVKIYENNTDQIIDSNHGGVIVSDIKNVTMEDVLIQDNFSHGFWAFGDVSSGNESMRTFMERVTVTGNGNLAIMSQGDSVITIMNSELDGACREASDQPDGTGKYGVITVDGDGVIDGPCPQD